MSASIEARQAMFSLVEQWQAGGLTQKQFCAQHNIVLHTFYYWYKRYRQQNDTDKLQPSNVFMEIQANALVNTGAALEILLAGGHRLLFHQPVSAAFIKEVIS